MGPDDLGVTGGDALAAYVAAGAAQAGGRTPVTPSVHDDDAPVLDNKQLSRLVRVSDPRRVWVSESGDFTPWLAENLDVLAAELGLTLTLVGTEVQVGEFRLDIQAEDDQGRVVVIENQLDRTDHGHLGQCLVYAAGLDVQAAAVVWVAPQFREDHRQAIDWLNRRTDNEVHFFAVEVGLVQIGGGPMAPVFDVVARPNEWGKVLQARTAAAASGGTSVSPLNTARQDFFLDVITEVASTRPTIRVPARNNGSWLSFASGPFGYWSLSQISDGRLRVEAYIDNTSAEQNIRLLRSFAAEADIWNARVGAPLEFDPMDGRRACRIALHHDLDLTTPAGERTREETRRWAARHLATMFDAMNAELRERAKELRQESER